MASSAGMWTFIVAISWFTFTESESSAWVGIITFATMLPFLIVSPFAGLLADRMDRRNMVVLSFGGDAFVVIVLTVLALTGYVQLWHIAVLAFLSGVFRTTSEPAIQALIPNQVPEADLLNAITLSAMTRHGARFFGLLVAAPLLAIKSAGWWEPINGVLVLSAGLYVASMFLMLRSLTASQVVRIPGQTAVGEILQGLSFIYRNRTIAVFILLVAFHCALVMSFESILPIFSEDNLGATDGSVLGYLVMGFGVGSTIGILLVAGVRNEKIKGQLLLWTGIASGVTPIVLALMVHTAPAVLIAALMGASQATFMAITNVYVITITPDRLRGRVTSLYVLHAGGIMAFANLGYGFLADMISAPFIFITTGVIFLVFLLSIMAGQPILRRIATKGEMTPITKGATA